MEEFVCRLLCFVLASSWRKNPLLVLFIIIYAAEEQLMRWVYAKDIVWRCQARIFENLANKNPKHIVTDFVFFPRLPLLINYAGTRTLSVTIYISSSSTKWLITCRWSVLDNVIHGHAENKIIVMRFSEPFKISFVSLQWWLDCFSAAPVFCCCGFLLIYYLVYSSLLYSPVSYILSAVSSW